MGQTGLEKISNDLIREDIYPRVALQKKLHIYGKKLKYNHNALIGKNQFFLFFFLKDKIHVFCLLSHCCKFLTQILHF